MSRSPSARRSTQPPQPSASRNAPRAISRTPSVRGRFIRCLRTERQQLTFRFVMGLRVARHRVRNMIEPIAVPLDRRSPRGPWIAAWRRMSGAAAPYLMPEFPLLAARLASEREPMLFGATDGTELRAALPLA